MLTSCVSCETKEEQREKLKTKKNELAKKQEELDAIKANKSFPSLKELIDKNIQAELDANKVILGLEKQEADLVKAQLEKQQVLENIQATISKTIQDLETKENGFFSKMREIIFDENTKVVIKEINDTFNIEVKKTEVTQSEALIKPIEENLVNYRTELDNLTQEKTKRLEEKQNQQKLINEAQTKLDNAKTDSEKAAAQTELDTAKSNLRNTESQLSLIDEDLDKNRKLIERNEIELQAKKQDVKNKIKTNLESIYDVLFKVDYDPVKKAKSRLSTIKDDIEDQEKQIVEDQKEITKLEEEIKNETDLTKKQEMENRVTELNTEITEAREEIKSKRQEFIDIEKHFPELLSKFHEKLRTLANDTRFAAKKTQAEKLQNQFIDVINVEDEVDKLQATKKDQLLQIETAKGDLEKAKGNVDKIIKDIVAKVKERDDLWETSIAGNSEEEKKLVTDYKRLNREIQELESEVKALEDQVGTEEEGGFKWWHLLLIIIGVSIILGIAWWLFAKKEVDVSKTNLDTSLTDI